jgi:ATP-dependent DNA ligase
MLPRLLPMLAVPSAPFDSPDYLFEIKWDGVRALLASDGDGWRLWGRGGVDYTLRYPELDVLCSALPVGTVLDGELVVWQDGRPHLAALLRRHGLTDPFRLRQAGRWCPVQYVAFDLLYQAGRSQLHAPLEQRRAGLAELCSGLSHLPLGFSAGVVGSGQALYAQALAAGHEGVVAKLRNSIYRCGQRSPTWRKIKPSKPRRPRCGPPALSGGLVPLRKSSDPTT